MEKVHQIIFSTQSIPQIPPEKYDNSTRGYEPHRVNSNTKDHFAQKCNCVVVVTVVENEINLENNDCLMMRQQQQPMVQTG